MSLKRSLVSVLAFVAGILCWAGASFAADLSAPTYLFTSGSARLLGMGDASVAVVDPTGYNTNPGTLALAFEDRIFIVSFKPRYVDGFYSSFASYFLAVSGQPLIRRTSRWQFALSLVNQFTAGQSWYYSVGRRDTNQFLGGYTYLLADRRRESIRAITVGVTRMGNLQFGLGATARNVQLDGSRIQYPHPSEGPIDGWNFDLGAIARLSLKVVESPSESRGNSVTIVPAIGLSCANLLRTQVRGINFITYPPLTQSGVEPIEPDRLAYVISSRMLRYGASVSISVSGSKVELIGFTGAFEYQIGSQVHNGSKIGTEFSLWETAGLRFGTGVLGVYEGVHSRGVSLSTAGLQKLLFRETVNSDGALKSKRLLRHLNLCFSYATISTASSNDLPEDYWTISLSL